MIDIANIPAFLRHLDDCPLRDVRMLDESTVKAWLEKLDELKAQVCHPLVFNDVEGWGKVPLPMHSGGICGRCGHDRVAHSCENERLCLVLVGRHSCSCDGFV